MKNDTFFINLIVIVFVRMATVVRLVSEAMGGAVELEKLYEFPWVSHLSELKFQLQSNIIPIGLIKKGIYYHRALLFKVQYPPHSIFTFLFFFTSFQNYDLCVLLHFLVSC